MVFDNLGGRIASHLARHWSRYLMYGATTAVGVAAAALLHRVPPTRGRKVVGHLGFIAVAVAICMLAPHDYQDVIFSPAGAAVAGVFFPVLESMRAVCSVTEEDDRRWLQYWLAQASFMVATSNLEWLVLNLFKSEAVRDVWFHMQVLFLLWLQLPWTDGSTLLYDTITKPFILPRIKGIAGRVSDSSLINTAWAWVINGSHLYGLYFVFVLMPGVVEKFIVDMVGTAYPLLASTVAVTTEDDPEDDTQWLVYWCVFSLFHVFASIVDDALDWIPGFHSVTLIVTARRISVWLMLPFTKGADRVFRQILVPLFNMRADLIKKDAALLVKDLSTKLPEAKRASVSSEIAAMFGAAQPQPARSKSPATTKPGKSE